MGNYIDASDIDNWPSGITAEEQEAIIKKAEQLVEEGCSDIFYEADFDIELNGNERSRIFIPIKPKILSVADVYVDGILLSPTWYDFDVNSVFIDLRASMKELKDGGFEKWKNASDPTYWIEVLAGTSTVSRDSDHRRTGSYCLSLNVSAANDDVYVYQDFTLSPNREYTLSLFYYMSAAGKTARWMLRDLGSNVYLDSNGSWTTTATWNSLANQTSYTELELEFIAYPLYSKYRLFLGRLSAVSASIYFDDASIQKKEGAGVSDPEYIYRMRRRRALFPRGYNNIRVVGTMGWAVTPEPIKQACVIIAKWENDPTLYNTLMKSEKIGDYSYTTAAGFQYITGIVEADLLLQNYVNSRPVIMAA